MCVLLQVSLSEVHGLIGMKGSPSEMMDVAHSVCLVFETLIKLLPEPEPLNEFYHSRSWRQKDGVRQVAGVRLQLESLSV